MRPLSKSMARWCTAALGTGALAGVAALVWWLQAEPERPKQGAATVSAQAKSPFIARGQLSPPARADELEAEDAPAPRTRVDTTGKQYLEKLFSRTVPNEILRAVSGCYSGEAADFERMTIEFTVELNEGVAMLSDVALLKSADHPQLEECAVDVMRTLTWRQSRAPDMVSKQQIEISVNDLVKRHKQFVRRDEEEND